MPTSTRRRSRVATAPSIRGIVGGDAPAPPTPPKPAAVLTPLSTRVPGELKREMKMLALAEDISLQDAIAEACREWVAARRPGVA